MWHLVFLGTLGVCVEIVEDQLRTKFLMKKCQCCLGEVIVSFAELSRIEFMVTFSTWFGCFYQCAAHTDKISNF